MLSPHPPREPDKYGRITETSGESHVAEIKVMLSAAFKEAYLELVPQCERAAGHKVVSLWVPSV